jgi:trehalose 6-phosphate phosphatase
VKQEHRLDGRHTSDVTSALQHEALAPLRSNPSSSAVLLDIDGTLSPIVQHAEDAGVPEATRQLLIAIARRYSLVACVSGRRASDARAMVSIGAISYVGTHGAELLEAGWTESRLDPRLEEWADRIAGFRNEVDTGELRRRRVRVEDKGPIIAFHWRGASDEEAAKEAVDSIATHAQGIGFDVHWGRKVMEVRPPVRIDKGLGITTLLAQRSYDAVLYAGDDTTDLDAFRALRQLEGAGTIGQALLVGVRSDDGPPEIEAEADIIVDGTDGVRELLAALLPS